MRCVQRRFRLESITRVDDQKNLLVVKGSVPGKPGSIVNIKPNNVVDNKGGEIL